MAKALKAQAAGSLMPEQTTQALAGAGRSWRRESCLKGQRQAIQSGKKKKWKEQVLVLEEKAEGKGKGEQHTWKAMHGVQVPLAPRGLNGEPSDRAVYIEDACGPGPGNGGRDGGTYHMGHEESFWEMGGVGIPQGPGSSLGSSEKVHQGEISGWPGESRTSDPSSHSTAGLEAGAEPDTSSDFHPCFAGSDSETRIGEVTGPRFDNRPVGHLGLV